MHILGILHNFSKKGIFIVIVPCKYDNLKFVQKQCNCEQALVFNKHFVKLSTAFVDVYQVFERYTLF